MDHIKRLRSTFASCKMLALIAKANGGTVEKRDICNAFELDLRSVSELRDALDIVRVFAFKEDNTASQPYLQDCLNEIEDAMKKRAGVVPGLLGIQDLFFYWKVHFGSSIEPGILDGTLAKKVSDTLMLSFRSDAELCDLRDLTVMYGNQTDKSSAFARDFISAVTTVIDHAKYQRGMEV